MALSQSVQYLQRKVNPQLIDEILGQRVSVLL